MVSAFNSVASCISHLGMIPGAKPLQFFIEKLPADDCKTFWIEPFILIGEAYKYYCPEAYHAKSGQGWVKWIRRGETIRSWLSTADALAQLSPLFKAFSTPIDKERLPQKKYSSRYRCDPAPNIKKISPLGEIGCLAKRFSSLAIWLIALGDAANEVRKYCSIPLLIEHTMPWIQTISGIYAGIQGFYEEFSFARSTYMHPDFHNRVWFSNHFHEEYSITILITNACSTASYALEGLRIYLGENSLKWMPRIKFYLQVANVILPICQRALKDQVEWVQPELRGSL